jgi:hypothetical protein
MTKTQVTALFMKNIIISDPRVLKENQNAHILKIAHLFPFVHHLFSKATGEIPLLYQTPL